MNPRISPASSIGSCLAACLFAFAVGCSAGPPPALGEEDAAVHGLVAGGAGTVQILFPDGTGCSGVLIHPRVLLTAAHCFTSQLGTEYMGMVSVRVSDTQDGEQWHCLWPTLGGYGCTEWRTTWVRRLGIQGGTLTDAQQGTDFAVLWSSPDVDGPPWRDVTDFRGLTTLAPDVGGGVQIYGQGQTQDRMEVGIFRVTRTTDRLVVTATGNSGQAVCAGDSGGPQFRSLNNWVTAITSAANLGSDHCARSEQRGYRITRDSIDVINTEISWVSPEGPYCREAPGAPGYFTCN